MFEGQGQKKKSKGHQVHAVGHILSNGRAPLRKPYTLYYRGIQVGTFDSGWGVLIKK